ncbi:MAG: phosphonoacetaldehyde reductase [Oscillospiraceae bacterium]|nr:phosphonoacetaldehyde reductase [Oscillospiraceae bacterium]
MAQIVFEGYGSYSNIRDVVEETGAKRIMAVCGASFKQRHSELDDTIAALNVDVTYFSGFSSNPDYASVVEGIKTYESSACELVVSIGGGSAIDTAKCIAIHECGADGELIMLKHAKCLHLAIPTTAGSGSEATCFAVIYKGGEKQSVEHGELLPDYVVLDPGFLATLPEYQKKSTMLDALCQAVESLWAKGATEESRQYARDAMEIILDNAYPYLAGENEAMRQMLLASHLAGKAINISKTTAAHAMSYKLTSMFGIAHGHAVALCLPFVWDHLLENLEMTADESITQKNAKDNVARLIVEMGLRHEFEFDDGIIGELAGSVNAQRLGNHPVSIPRRALLKMYQDALSSPKTSSP